MNVYALLQVSSELLFTEVLHSDHDERDDLFTVKMTLKVMNIDMNSTPT